MALNLVELRKEKGLSQGDVAKVLGTSRQVISRYERGEAEMTYATLAKLSKYFDVSIDYLLGNTTYYYPDNVGAYSSMPQLSADEQELLARYRGMRADVKEAFWITFRAMTNSTQETTKNRA